MMQLETISTALERVLTPVNSEAGWTEDLERFLQGDVSLTRTSVGESAVKAVQRLLIFLGYSTTTRGAFSIDGDFGRGTNRGVAQFQFESDLNQDLKVDTIAYPCSWRTAHREIIQIPDATLDLTTLNQLIREANRAIKENHVVCGDLDEALIHLNALQSGSYFSSKKILHRYADLAIKAAQQVLAETDKTIQPQWILAIIKQETSGVVRPRFEQHLFSKYWKNDPTSDLRELRYRSMSMGLGQVLGVNYQRVGAVSPQAMYTSPLDQQVLFVARFLARKAKVVAKLDPSEDDFHTLSRYYNGSGYKTHFYHESLQRWFKEFLMLM